MNTIFIELEYPFETIILVRMLPTEYSLAFEIAKVDDIYLIEEIKESKEF